MKPATLILLALFSLAGMAPACAEEPATTDDSTESTDTGSDATRAAPETILPAQAAGMKHKGKCQHGKGHGGKKHGGDQHGMGHGGKKHGGSQHGKEHGKGHGGQKHGACRQGDGGHDKHRQVVQRLDMLEARMAKIEAMLEILLRR
jgi:hypothetical protein